MSLDQRPISPTGLRAPRVVDRDVLREMVALVMIVLGVAGLLVLAYVIDWRLGAATTFTAMIAGGVLMGMDR